MPLNNGEKDSQAEIITQPGSLDDVAGMSDEKVDEIENTVWVDTITFCTSRRGSRANSSCSFCS